MRIFCRILFTIVVVACTSAPVFASRFIITGADAGGGPHVIVRYDADNNGTFETISDSFYAFAPASPQAPLFAGGVRVATGDFDGDGNDELVTAMGPGGSTVRIWSLTSGGMVSGLVEEFSPYGGFTGGVFVATGDFAGTAGAEIITSPGAGGGPHVRIFTDTDADGIVSDNPPFEEFFAYAPGFSGGVRVAVGDTDNSGTFVEVITAPGPGGGPHIRVVDDNGDSGSLITDNPVDDEFFAYDPAWSGGVFVAAGRFGGTAAAFGGQPIVIVDASTTTLFVCVPAGAGNIRDLDVGLGITHTFNVDLDVTLTHLASGVSVQLFTDVGNNDDGFMVRLNDEAATDIGTVVDDANDKPVAGSFNPEGTALLSAFDGLSASGCWALTVTDDVGSDFGTLFDWILFFTF